MTPTKRTPWFRLFPQLLKTPEEYFTQLLASTPIETGLWMIAPARTEQELMFVKPEILKGPEFILHLCYMAV